MLEHTQVTCNIRVDEIATKGRECKMNWSAGVQDPSWRQITSILKDKSDEAQKLQLDMLADSSYTIRLYKCTTQNYKRNPFLSDLKGLETSRAVRTILTLRTGNAILLSQFREKYKFDKYKKGCLICMGDEAFTTNHLLECPACICPVRSVAIFNDPKMH